MKKQKPKKQSAAKRYAAKPRQAKPKAKPAALSPVSKPKVKPVTAVPMPVAKPKTKPIAAATPPVPKPKVKPVTAVPMPVSKPKAKPIAAATPPVPKQKIKPVTAVPMPVSKPNISPETEELRRIETALAQAENAVAGVPMKTAKPVPAGLTAEITELLDELVVNASPRSASTVSRLAYVLCEVIPGLRAVSERADITLCRKNGVTFGWNRRAEEERAVRSGKLQKSIPVS